MCRCLPVGCSGIQDLVDRQAGPCMGQSMSHCMGGAWAHGGNDVVGWGGVYVFIVYTLCKAVETTQGAKYD